MNKLKSVLKKIREVCPELQQASEIKLYTVDGGDMTICIPEGYLTPIHLEHLLRAIGDSKKTIWSVDMYGVMWEYTGGELQWTSVVELDLTKSVEQNLTDNPELLDLVAELLGVE